ncbi:MAG: tRNA-(ms[2]io[6]A)-hydroxylase [Bradymonadia bacterium]|jgi:tRNA-(ms[2]io[6]A)-hydroxylase
MLNLHAPTAPEWLPLALEAMDEVLLDHAHCEKKAASTALSLLFKYPDHTALQRPLSELAREELAHFELVLSHLERRGVPFRRQRPSPYAGRLMEAVRANEPQRLLDTLLCMSLIEARSCERMKLLSEALLDPDLVALYRGLLASEARHHTTYVDLARAFYAEAEVRARLAELAAHEAAVLDHPWPAPLARMHT